VIDINRPIRDVKLLSYRLTECPVVVRGAVMPGRAIWSICPYLLVAAVDVNAP
jgi:hypothetical protein